MFYGSFTLTVEAETEEEMKEKLDKLGDCLAEFDQMLPTTVDISGWDETKNEWSS